MAITPGSRSAQARQAPSPSRARKSALLRPQLPLPILKWAGGKSRLLDQLVAHVPARFGRYFEPFVGGAALFFRLRPERATLSDLNPDLINVYRSVAFDLDAVKRRLAVHQTKHTETYYYEMRTRWNQAGAIADGADRAAAFIYLNKTCYNGLWRVNSKGEFNVPVGRYDDPSILDPANLAAAGKVLARAELHVRSYTAVADAAEAGDFVYFDPPYQPVSETARFVSYTSASFGENDQRALADLVHGLARRGVHVMVSNSDTPLIRDIYRGLVQHQVLCARAINSRASARGPARELVIVGGPRPR
jgi:DNA adenine methylase